MSKQSAWDDTATKLFAEYYVLGRDLPADQFNLRITTIGKTFYEKNQGQHVQVIAVTVFGRQIAPDDFQDDSLIYLHVSGKYVKKSRKFEPSSFRVITAEQIKNQNIQNDYEFKSEVIEDVVEYLKSYREEYCNGNDIDF